jgi:predicted methyltransferase
MIVLSYLQVEPVLKARQAGQLFVSLSTDLGLTHIQAQVRDEGLYLPGESCLYWEQVEAIYEARQSCFFLEDGSPEKIQRYSETTGRYYSLMPTEQAPTLLLSGIPMHRIKGIDPYHDTLTKIKTIQPVVGQVLDTTTGLGYTAIQAARTAEKVITIELDPLVLEVARLNPWSQELFANPRITQMIGDSAEKVFEFEERSFSRIIHDPPMFSLAGELYSAQFYKQLYKTLSNAGKLFHYIGDLESKSGQRVIRGVARRLREAGFMRIAYHPEAFGVVAYK